MNHVSIKINARGLDAMIDAFRDLETAGVQRAQQALDQVLDRTAEISYGLAHLDEGQLRASQGHSSTHDRNGWSGSVSYTGRGAAFEMAKGGDHAAFIDDLSRLSAEDFTAAIDSMFDGM